jgi:Putative transmembrane protein (PGPGW)
VVQWIGSNKEVIMWLTAVSTVTFVVCLIVVPFLVVRMPSDYFAKRKTNGKLCVNRHLFARCMLMIAKNLLGCILVMAGMVMLVLPGQGVLTILIGIMLLNFPGKYKLERWIVSRQPVFRSINWIRQRAGKEPLVFEG